MPQTKKESRGGDMKNLLWATDFSRESRFCLPYIKFFSDTLNTVNHALHVMPKFAEWVYETAFPSDEELIRNTAKNREKSLNKILSDCQKANISSNPQILEGLASDEILKYAVEQKVNLIFAGRKGNSDIEHILIGSTTSRLIRNSMVPVCVISHPKRDARIERILCPIDFTDFSLMELDYAINLARQMNVKLYVAHISEFFSYKVPVFKRDILLEKINEKIRDIASDHRYNIENIFYDIGEPAQKIIEIARKNKMDVIVMATHQRKGVEKFFLGSITEKVLMYSDIPVIVLPPKN